MYGVSLRYRMRQSIINKRLLGCERRRLVTDKKRKASMVSSYEKEELKRGERSTSAYTSQPENVLIKGHV